MQFLGAPLDAVGGPPATVSSCTGSVTAENTPAGDKTAAPYGPDGGFITPKHGTFIDGSVHFMAKTPWIKVFGGALATKFVAAATAVLGQLPDQQLSVRQATPRSGTVN